MLSLKAFEDRYRTTNDTHSPFGGGEKENQKWEEGITSQAEQQRENSLKE